MITNNNIQKITFEEKIFKTVKHVFFSAEANEFYKGERYSSFGCTNPCKHMKVLTEFKHKTKIVDKKTETEDPIVKILFPRSIEVTKEVWRKTFLSFGKFN